MRLWVGLVTAIGVAATVAGCSLLSRSAPPQTGNELCFVCHIDFAPEEIVARHAAQGIGCINCHGASIDHMHNEENVIPPDIMYRREEINALCLVCHAPLAYEHPPYEWRTTADGEVCTDCHGRHRVENPRRRWDRETRELLPDV